MPKIKSKMGTSRAKVTILGAAGGIGQPLALLFMLNPEYVQHISLYDLDVSIRGVGVDLSHVDRPCKVTTHLGQDELAEAVRGAKVIVCLAGLAQKPGMSRDDLFGTNAKIMYNLAKVCAQHAPDAMLAIVSNPVNSLVPLTCEVYHRLLAGNTTAKGDSYRRIFGVTTLDVTRAATLTARSALCKPSRDPSRLHVPVVGGHAGRTIIPLLSHASPKLDKKSLEDVTTNAVIDSIQQAGIDVLNAKKGKGSATLAMAYAAYRFTISLLKAVQGDQDIIECAYVRHEEPVYGQRYFSMPLTLSRDGYTKAHTFEHLSNHEQQMIEEGAKELRISIAKGEDFAKENLSSERL